MKSINFCCLMLIAFALSACFNKSGPDQRLEADVVMVTDSGDVFIKLYDETPLHKENFLKLTKEGFFDGMAFHRIISQFMVQVGDPRSKEGGNWRDKVDDAGYRLEPEIVDTFFHTIGKVGAARYPFKVKTAEGVDSIMNPNWESSSSQFYIVTGAKSDDAKLDGVEVVIDRARQELLFEEYTLKYEAGEYTDIFNNYLADLEYTVFGYSDKQREIYKRVKGAPHLDLQYTIFGEVTEGMDVVKKLEYLQTTPSGQPTTTVRVQRMMMLEEYMAESATEEN